nr:MAG TPA: hypothetical protein [Caudoviricetes sp.]
MFYRQFIQFSITTFQTIKKATRCATFLKPLSAN